MHTQQACGRISPKIKTAVTESKMAAQAGTMTSRKSGRTLCACARACARVCTCPVLPGHVRAIRTIYRYLYERLPGPDQVPTTTNGRTTNGRTTLAAELMMSSVHSSWWCDSRRGTIFLACACSSGVPGQTHYHDGVCGHAHKCVEATGYRSVS